MALTPIPLVAETYELQSRAASAVRLCNLYPERLPDGGRAPFILKPSPGLRIWTIPGNGPIYGMASIPGYLYTVSGSHAHRHQPSGLLNDDLGDIGFSQTPSIAIGPSQVIIVSPPNAWICNHEAATMTQIPLGVNNFPAEGVSSVCYIDGYFIFTSADGDYFFTSKLGDGDTFDPLDFAKSERRPDALVHCVAHNGELWLFGRAHIEVWYNAGAADFAFRPRAGGVIDRGLGAARSVAVLDGSLWFLGMDRMVYRTRGYQLERVSSHQIEEVLSQYNAGTPVYGAELIDIAGCAFMFEGHAFYTLHLPSAENGGQTYLYDVESGKWHQRSSAVDGEGPWLASAANQFGPRLLLGDHTAGVLYDVDQRDGSDIDGTPFGGDVGQLLRRIAVLPPIITHGPRAFMSRLEVEMEVGTLGAPGSVLLDWSDDGGNTWSAPRVLLTGEIGQTRTRVATTRLGSFRTRLIRLRASGRATFYAVDVEIATGGH